VCKYFEGDVQGERPAGCGGAGSVGGDTLYKFGRKEAPVVPGGAICHQAGAGRIPFHIIIRAAFVERDKELNAAVLIYGVVGLVVRDPGVVFVYIKF
jgi:hypothetical protein